jgi:glycosyltransferase involved in cell wall biosynthesis
MPQPRIAILIPAYNEGGNIAPLLRELSATLAGLPDYDFTILFVDDGSTDATAALLEQAAATDPRLGPHRRPPGPRLRRLHHHGCRPAAPAPLYS